jgi:hypothetical protein
MGDQRCVGGVWRRFLGPTLDFPEPESPIVTILLMKL